MSNCSSLSFKRESNFYIDASQARLLADQQKPTTENRLKLNQRIYAFAASIFKKIWSFIFTTGLFDVGAKEAWNQCFKGNRFTKVTTPVEIIKPDSSKKSDVPGTESTTIASTEDNPAPAVAVVLTRADRFRRKCISDRKGQQFGPEKRLQYTSKSQLPLPTCYLKKTQETLQLAGI
jgi:hypothetical protein